MNSEIVLLKPQDSILTVIIIQWTVLITKVLGMEEMPLSNPNFFKSGIHVVWKKMNIEKCVFRVEENTFVKGPISLAWRLGDDSSLCDVSRRPGSREIQTCSIVLETFSGSSRSRRRLCDWSVSAVAGDVSLVRAQAIFWSPELPQLISRGDVSASEIGP